MATFDRKAYMKAYYEKNKDQIKIKRTSCIHGRVKTCCKECGGGSVCIHGKYKKYCKDCGGSAYCEHGKNKNKCKDCDLPKYLIYIQRKNLNRVLKSTNIEKNETIH